MIRIGKTAIWSALALSAMLAPAPWSQAASAPAPAAHAAYSDDEVTRAANDFFKSGAQDLGKVLQKVLKEKGQPVAIIRG